MSASSFKDKTFNVEMVTASGIKTHDFDFKAINYRTEINVEVTACTNDRFSYKNLSNVLAAKRKQLPNNAPAILFCDIPERWLSHYPDLKFGVMQTTFDFFKKSRRINAIVYYVMHQIRHLKSAVVSTTINVPLFNSSARYQTDLSFLCEDVPGSRSLLKSAVKGSVSSPFFDSFMYWGLISKFRTDH
jgi:hypothetical protein